MKRIAILVVVASAAAALATGSLGAGAHGESADAPAKATSTPFTFYLTHYVLLGSDPNNPTGVRYENSGHPSAQASDGSTIALAGKGGWTPAAGTATGGGSYQVTNSAGAETASGTWQAVSFTSFLQLPGWWPNGFKELGWQGPPGSVSYSGVLTLNVHLSGLGDGVLTLYCVMPGTPPQGGNNTDGLTLTGPNLPFTTPIQSYEGVMYYSAGATK